MTEIAAQLCPQSHYATVVEANHKTDEIYQLGEADCACCLQRMVDKHEALAEVFRRKRTAIGDAR